MTELAGIDADRVSMASWILCSVLAGLAGVLLAPLFAAVSELNYTTLVVVAMSAAVLAALTSIPIAFSVAWRSVCSARSSTRTCRRTACSRATCGPRCRSSCCSSC